MFENNFGIDNDFTKYISRRVVSNVMINIWTTKQIFFSAICFCLKYFKKNTRLLLAAVSIVGLRENKTFQINHFKNLNEQGTHGNLLY